MHHNLQGHDASDMRFSSANAFTIVGVIRDRGCVLRDDYQHEGEGRLLCHQIFYLCLCASVNILYPLQPLPPSHPLTELLVLRLYVRALGIKRQCWTDSIFVEALGCCSRNVPGYSFDPTHRIRPCGPAVSSAPRLHFFYLPSRSS